MKEKKSARINLAGISAEAAAAQLNAKYGSATLVSGKQALGIQIDYISTGCYELDFALSGGIPKNRMTMIYGPYSSLKSTLAYTAVVNFQQGHENGEVYIIDVERTFDAVYAQKLGVNLEQVWIVNASAGEEAGDIALDLMTRQADLFVIVDSIAALVPTGDLELSLDEGGALATQAKLVNRLLRNLTARMKRSMYDASYPSTTVMLMNQLRAKPGVVYGSNEYSPGGNGKEFYMGTIIRVSSTPSQAIKEDVSVGGVKKTIRYGQVVSFRVTKNKCGGDQHAEGEFEFYVRPYKGNTRFSFNNYDALFQHGVFHKVIVLENKRYRYMNVEAGNEAHFLKKLRYAKPSILRNLYRDVLQAVREDFLGKDETTETEVVSAD